MLNTLKKNFLKGGNQVKIIKYNIEKVLPILVRHCFYFLKILPWVIWADFILALDTFSVGWPAVCAAKLLRKKVIIRVGGDFLWENYVEDTGSLITLRDFNDKLAACQRSKLELSLKYKIALRITRFVLNNAILVFTTFWQRDIWQRTYNLKKEKLFVIENFFGPKQSSNIPARKNFLWFGRKIKIKNIKLLEEVFAELNRPEITLHISQADSETKLWEEYKNCYAVILPSLSDISPNFILGAIRFNKPFICTKETGLYEKLKDIGLFINPLDREDIKNKVLFLADDANYLEYKKKVENFNFTHSWQQIAAEFLQI